MGVVDGISACDGWSGDNDGSSVVGYCDSNSDSDGSSMLDKL